MKKIGIYIHIPFCTKRCIYCNFLSCTDTAEKAHADYFSALHREIAYNKSKGLFDNVCVDTIYFGGGTPTAVMPHYINDVLKAVQDAVSIEANAEISMEANPETLLKHGAEAYVKGGINRFSIGLQSADDRLLKFLQRGHSRQDFIDALLLLQQSGVDNISADVLLGIPGQSAEDVAYTANFLIESGVKHVSAYGLKPERGTALQYMIDNKTAAMPDDDACADYYDIMYKELKNSGINRYEVSNFCRAGYQCRHNLKYWQVLPFIGMGASAHSHIGGVRFNNIADIKTYCAADGIGFENIRTYIPISAEDAEFEYIMLNLRLSKGMDLHKFEQEFGNVFAQKYVAILQKYSYFFDVSDNRICLNDAGFYVQNTILAEFLP